MFTSDVARYTVIFSLQESRSSLSMMSPQESLPGLECTNDSLPSVTLLQSGMAKSLPAVSTYIFLHASSPFNHSTVYD